MLFDFSMNPYKLVFEIPYHKSIEEEKETFTTL